MELRNDQILKLQKLTLKTINKYYKGEGSTSCPRCKRETNTLILSNFTVCCPFCQARMNMFDLFSVIAKTQGGKDKVHAVMAYIDPEQARKSTILSRLLHWFIPKKFPLKFKAAHDPNQVEIKGPIFTPWSSLLYTLFHTKWQNKLDVVYAARQDLELKLKNPRLSQEDRDEIIGNSRRLLKEEAELRRHLDRKIIRFGSLKFYINSRQLVDPHKFDRENAIVCGFCPSTLIKDYFGDIRIGVTRDELQKLKAAQQQKLGKVEELKTPLPEVKEDVGKE